MGALMPLRTPRQPAVPSAEERGTHREWRGWMTALWLYLALDALLLLGAALLPPLASWVALVAVVALGVLALAVGVAWQRPDVRVGWWLIVSAYGLFAVADAAALVRFMATGVVATGGALILVPAVGFPLLLAGLVLLARLGGPPDPADTLDALTIALATFLVLFAFVIHPVLEGGWAPVVSAIILPLGVLLILAMTVRVGFSIGRPTVSVGLVLLAQCVHFAAAAGVMVSALRSTGLDPTNTGSLLVLSPALWTVSLVLLGAAGLHPSLRRTCYRPGRRQGPLSKRRMVLAVVLVVVVPIAW